MFTVPIQPYGVDDLGASNEELAHFQLADPPAESPLALSEVGCQSALPWGVTHGR